MSTAIAAPPQIAGSLSTSSKPNRATPAPSAITTIPMRALSGLKRWAGIFSPCPWQRCPERPRVREAPPAPE